jgi:hypothetical protein
MVGPPEVADETVAAFVTVEVTETAAVFVGQVVQPAAAC